jgi:oxygen-independent coproporphyrinogen-3 oxidase
VKSQAQDFSEESYALAIDFLQAAGYRRYEVSNFALPGHESRHNLGYWRGEDYLGVGASAVSTVDGERRTNPVSVAAYLAGEPPAREWISRETRLFERAMLGLRTAEGVPEIEVRPVLDPGAWSRAEAGELATTRCGTLFLTQRGLDVSNALLAELLVVPDQRAFPAGV